MRTRSTPSPAGRRYAGTGSIRSRGSGPSPACGVVRVRGTNASPAPARSCAAPDSTSSSTRPTSTAATATSPGKGPALCDGCSPELACAQRPQARPTQLPHPGGDGSRRRVRDAGHLNHHVSGSGDHATHSNIRVYAVNSCHAAGSPGSRPVRLLEVVSSCWSVLPARGAGAEVPQRRTFDPALVVCTAGERVSDRVTSLGHFKGVHSSRLSGLLRSVMVTARWVARVGDAPERLGWGGRVMGLECSVAGRT